MMNVNYFNRILAVKQCGGCGVAITDRFGIKKDMLCGNCVKQCAEADRQRRVKKHQEAMKAKYGGGRKNRHPFKDFEREPICKRCGESEREYLGDDEEGNGKYGAWCRPCLNEYHYDANKKWRDENVERINRTDGICPRCKVNEKHQISEKRSAGYCKECVREIARERRAKLSPPAPKKEKVLLCPKCKSADKYITANGGISQYCRPCQNEVSRIGRVKRKQKGLTSA